MLEKNNRHTQIFLDRLNWQTNTGEMVQIFRFKIDVYLFQFKTPLTGKCMTDFTGYIKQLSMTELKSVMKIWVWLYQHDVKFKLRFSYNTKLPFAYNIKHIGLPKKINKTLYAHGHDDIMSCQLDLI